VQIQTASRYTLSASGSSSASAKAFVAEELSPIQSPDAANQFEKCGLESSLIGVVEVKLFLFLFCLMPRPWITRFSPRSARAAAA
jgi:uncharacterized protein YoaH (UPF0181 family)